MRTASPSNHIETIWKNRSEPVKAVESDYFRTDRPLAGEQQGIHFESVGSLSVGDASVTIYISEPTGSCPTKTAANSIT